MYPSAERGLHATHELGVRVALGAQMGDLIKLVVTEGMNLGVIGVAIGAGVTLVASFIPARRAARLDPNWALRSD